MKQKAYKLLATNRETIEYFKRFVSASASQSIYASAPSFAEKSERSEYLLTSKVRMANFTLEIYYTPMYLTEADCVDFKIRFDESEFYYSIYDIFNYNDTPDFELYSFTDCGAERPMQRAVESIFEVCTRNLGNIDYFAKHSDALERLNKQIERDAEVMWGGIDEWKSEWRESTIDMLFEKPTVDYSENGIKSLMENKDDDEYNTLYEQRLIRYIERGGKLENTAAAQNEIDSKIARKAIAAGFAVVAAISLLISCAVIFGLRFCFFSGAYMPQLETADTIFSVVICAVFLLIPLGSLFMRAIIGLVAGREHKNLAILKFRKYFEHYGMLSDKVQRAIEIGFAIFMIPAALGMFSICTEDIGFYDDYVKFVSPSEYRFCEIKYEDMHVYNIEGMQDEAEFIKYEGSALAVGDGKEYYYFGEMEDGGETEEYLLDLCEKYGIEIETVKTIEVLDEKLNI